MGASDDVEKERESVRRQVAAEREKEEADGGSCSSDALPASLMPKSKLFFLPNFNLIAG